METDLPGIWELNTELLALWQSDALSHDWVLPDNFHSRNKVTAQLVENAHFFNTPVEVVTEINAPQKKGRAMGANITHSIDGMIVREMSRRCSFNPDHIINLLKIIQTGSRAKPSRIRPNDELVEILWSHYERTNFLSVRIIDLLDADNIGMVDPQRIAALISTLPQTAFPILTTHDCFRAHPNYGNDLRIQYAEILADLNDSTILADIASQLLQTEIVVEKRGLTSSEIRAANYQLS